MNLLFWYGVACGGVGGSEEGVEGGDGGWCKVLKVCRRGVPKSNKCK